MKSRQLSQQKSLSILLSLTVSITVASLIVGCSNDVQFATQELSKFEQPITEPPPVVPPPIVVTPPPIVVVPPTPPPVIPPPEPVPEPEPQPSSKTITAYQQAEDGKMDILFVIDNSDSMYNEQQEIARRFNTFINDLGGMDWQIAITTTDAREKNYPGWGGRLDKFGNTNQIVLKPNTPNRTSLFQSTIQRDESLDCIEVGGEWLCPTTHEEPLRASILAMQQRNTHNAGFFRDDADLSIVYISDEDEYSNGGPQATRPEEVMQTFSGIWPNKKLSSFGIIIQPGDSSCYSRNRWWGASYGHIISDLVSKTGGVTGSICDSNYTNNVLKISEVIRRELLLKEIHLAETPISNSIEVVITPYAPVAWTLEGKTIKFITLPPEGSRIDVNYKFWP